MPERPEYKFLLQLKSGDKRGLEYVYSQYYGRIYAFCHRFFRQSQLTEEATADVFIKLWQRREQIDPALNILAFLFKIAKDISLNYLKKVARDDRLKSEYALRYLIDNAKSGEQQLIAQEELEIYLNMIDRLPPKRKAIFKMRYEESMDYQSIADRMNISPNTVKVQLIKARQYLKLQVLNREQKSSLT
ncbi:MAG: RNA polymerase sigma-70 factor [Bacteroidota bacterium]